MIDDKILHGLMYLAKEIAEKQATSEDKSLIADDVTAVFDKLVEKMKAAQSA